jgi:hypothetical protein
VLFIGLQTSLPAEPQQIEKVRRASKALACPLAARPSINKPLLVDLIRGEYMGKRENNLFVACQQGKMVRFFRVTQLITLLLKAEEERQR